MMFKFFGKKKEKAKGPRAVISEFNFKEVRALQIASVFTCVRIISESIAMLPINIYKIVDGEKELAVKHPLYKIFRHKPNPNDTPVEFMEKLISDVFALENINTCPHGRPIEMKMSKKELEKNFKRIV